MTSSPAKDVTCNRPSGVRAPAAARAQRTLIACCSWSGVITTFNTITFAMRPPKPYCPSAYSPMCSSLFTCTRKHTHRSHSHDTPIARGGAARTCITRRASSFATSTPFTKSIAEPFAPCAATQQVTYPAAAPPAPASRHLLPRLVRRANVHPFACGAVAKRAGACGCGTRGGRACYRCAPSGTAPSADDTLPHPSAAFPTRAR